MSQTLPRIAIAGAGGFVGQALVRALRGHAHLIALGRRVEEGAPASGGVEWRRCDLFSLRDSERALEGVDIAVYLVHSMLPSARLTQARFEDLDLLLADNFGRAAASQGVERIVYLGGLVPMAGNRDALSTHLASRLETEEALGGHAVPVTAVRAGLVVGAGGSSLQMLVRLVKRLPLMLCPRWTQTRCQPIGIADLIRILTHCIEDDETRGRVCEVGGPDVLTYREMMAETARILGLRRKMFSVPFFSPGLSRLWVSLITRSPRALTSPLIRSLKTPMEVEDPWLLERMGFKGQPFADALRSAIEAEGYRKEPVVRSLQRLPLPPQRDARWTAHEYTRWLAGFLRPFLRADVYGDVCRLTLRGFRRTLLELTYRPERSDSSRALFEISGGLLAGSRIGFPRLEFRVTPEGDEVIVAVQDFHPRLPWYLYASTQALAHLWVMASFRRHLRRLCRSS